MSIYDIYIAYVSWGEDGKRRPVLVLEQGTYGVTVFNITTRYDGKSEAVQSKYFKINDWRQAGLKHESYIDTNETVTLPQSSVEHFLGTLTEADVQSLLEFLTQRM
jgi:mRNA-degrading endonuclease toxin of MazEF toxin-antitoxin module